MLDVVTVICSHRESIHLFVFLLLWKNFSFRWWFFNIRHTEVLRQQRLLYRQIAAAALYPPLWLNCCPISCRNFFDTQTCASACRSDIISRIHLEFSWHAGKRIWSFEIVCMAPNTHWRHLCWNRRKESATWIWGQSKPFSGWPGIFGRRHSSRPQFMYVTCRFYIVIDHAKFEVVFSVSKWRSVIFSTPQSCKVVPTFTYIIYYSIFLIIID